jgi:small-conductance mechanosensitive channel
MDSYAAASSSAWYRAHANVLTHLARQVDVAEQDPGDTTIVAGDTSSAGLAARDRVIQDQRAEIARLSAELERLSTELERIKRRLATPTP